MSNPKTAKANSMLILGLVILALIGFIVAAYYQTLEEFDTMRAEIKSVQGQNRKDIDSLIDQMNKRYLTLLKQADDMEQQKAKLSAVDRSITGEREALAQIEDTFHAELAQVKRAGADSSKDVASLQDKFDQEIKVRGVTLAKLQDDYLNIKNEVEDQQTLLVMMREQSLLDKYKQPQDGRTTVDPSAPASTEAAAPAADTSTVTRADGATPVTPMTNVVPTNNRVVTDLPSPATAPTATTEPATGK